MSYPYLLLGLLAVSMLSVWVVLDAALKIKQSKHPTLFYALDILQLYLISISLIFACFYFHDLFHFGWKMIGEPNQYALIGIALFASSKIVKRIRKGLFDSDY